MTYRTALIQGCIIVAVLGSPSQPTRADSAGVLELSRSVPLTVVAQSDPAELPSAEPVQLFDFLEDAQSRRTASRLIQLLLMVTVLSLAPAIIVMVTCFVRIIVVLALTRQALGTSQLPPTQILVGLAIMLSILIMAPTWSKLNNQALQPFLSGQLTSSDALQQGQVPLRAFMIRQIDACKNQDDVWMFLERTGFKTSDSTATKPTWSDVPTRALIPAFVISELKTAFLMGFKIYLPFLVIDMVVASILISMGMLMLPPILISLPFKILLFVLVDGWHLLVGSLLESFAL